MQIKLFVFLLLMALEVAICSKASKYYLNRGGNAKVRECWVKCEEQYEICWSRSTKKNFIDCRRAKRICDDNCRIKRRLKVKVGSRLKKAMNKIWGSL